MVGKLSKSEKGGHVYLLVAVDKFTKWIEAMPVTNQGAEAAIKFIESIIYRFGMPHSIISDNGSNFTSDAFRKFCGDLGIRLSYASVAHPQTNGQVEKANGLVCDGIKKRLLTPLEKAAGKWVSELPSVLWSLRTTPNASTGRTPFFLVHGAEAVLPAELLHKSPRVMAYSEVESNIALEDDMDALDEARDVVLSRNAVYQQSLRNYHSRRMRHRPLEKGNLVLKLKQKGHLKFESPWEGPYIIDEVIGEGVFRIRELKNNRLEANPWNVAQLRRYYP
jgi:transposase InsO family protein